MTIQSYDAATGKWTEIAEDAPSFEPVLTPAEARAEWRLNGFLSRAEFCVNANAMGLLTDADAEKAAAGAWPDSFEPIIASWPTAERIRARSKWATNANIYRNDPLLALLAASLTPNLTDAQLDTLCGWAG